MDFSIGRAVSILHRFGQSYVERELGPLGIGAAQLPVLHHLYRRDGLHQEEIARFLRTDKGALARTVARLEAAGYVERRPDPDDGRARRLFLTDKAREVRPRLRRTLKAWTRALSQGFTEEERDALAALLERMTENAERALEHQPVPRASERRS